MARVYILMVIMGIAANAKAYSIKNDTVAVICENDTAIQIIVTIKNTDDNLLWIWFDDSNIESEKRLIKSHLMKRKGDFSIYDIATDPNMYGNWWKYPMPLKEAFVKCLSPYRTFTIILYKTNNDSQKDTTVIDFIKTFTNDRITKYCPGIDTEYGIKRISFPFDSIMIPMSFFASSGKKRQDQIQTTD